MVESRAVKRRRVSDAAEDNEDGIASSEVPETPPAEDEDPMDIDESEADVAPAATPSKSSRRRSTAVEAAELEDKETPSKSVRASGRQRKAPQRFEEQVFTSKRRQSRKTGETPSKTPQSARGTRSARKDVSVDEMSPESRVLLRKRSTRSVRSKKEEDIEPTPDTTESPTMLPHVNGGMDDSYDPVAAQLQQDLVQEIETQDEQVQAVSLPEYAEEFYKLCDPHFREEVRMLSRFVLEKLNGTRLVPLKGLDAEYQKVYQLVEQTVTAGEGNSMLLMGSRGSGKTAMVESIISSLSKDHNDDFHVVRLNGFFHTNDQLALREIWRQLGRETNTEEEASKINSYADTMATLLALLSHPEELFDGSGNVNGIATAKSVVIVLEEFDLFATHPRQTLLYNLFDIAQARKAPLAVLGLTTKVDVTEALEKRVKSRFSHRYVFLPSAKTFESFAEACLAGLDIEDGEVQDSELGQLKPGIRSQLLDGWKSFLKGLWADKDFETHLRRIYNQTKSVKDFFSSALLPIATLHHSAYTLNDEAISLEIPIPQSFTSHTLACPDPAPLPFASSMTGSTSSTSLPLSLLLAATRLTAIYDPGLDVSNPQDTAPLALSFPAAYTEYVRLLTSAKASAAAQGAAVTGGRVWGRDVSREAWEKLVSWGVVVPLGSGNGTTDGKMFRVEVSYEEVTDMVGGGGSLGRWWRD
ncbi:putative origin recognition complex subunit Orc4 [Talaromyces proteolyticus]|uniref:Origin recognition complex subunit Orc4 n=1 Tax=Talaromyces proteolyticus TaxID=1131652 RepID=A0AAD4KG68_9EURO|nr:putative origin recognition complex subunit Orc4 [Talaromyces proteolyticus]KAH8691349.1 putative origin recognition complex subunit Orc4 [Talaromyces proteolyticus]